MPSCVSRSHSSSGAERTAPALVPRTYVIGAMTAVARSDLTVRRGVIVLRLGPARSVQRKHVPHRAIDRRGHTSLLPKLNDAAGQPLDFERIAALEIVVER